MIKIAITMFTVISVCYTSVGCSKTEDRDLPIQIQSPGTVDQAVIQIATKDCSKDKQTYKQCMNEYGIKL